MVRLADADDPRLRDYTRLTDVRLRVVKEPAEGLFMAESTQVIRRALRAGHRMRSLLVAPRWLPDMADVLEAAAAQGAPVMVAEEPLLQSITGFHLHRGALASMHRPALRPVAEVVAGARRVVVLEDVVDHTNIGAVFRSAAAMGVEAVLVTPRCADPLYRRSVRVSMGTVFQVPWTRVETWPGGVEELRQLGFVVAALALDERAENLDVLAADPPERLAWVLGTEGDGLRPGTVRAADRVVRIPMTGGVDSLNVAAAGAVAFWATRPPVAGP
ncbi:TrmH family RNA methyltransferase [Aquipuribacter hungaricus]|uniref:TrmH family RNA methyltransferase n=1 Tax=Aquipuribacter hungaricus TaxID=545624 RepID=A0ABV7WGF4_9MICO